MYPAESSSGMTTPNDRADGSVNAAGLTTFPDVEQETIRDDPHRREQPLTETRLARSLRIWLHDPSTLTEGGQTVEREIYGLLERYICECLTYGPDNLSHWWSDGVTHLELTHIGIDAFKFLGVSWIDSLGIAPFEIDVELSPPDGLHFTKTIFRIGILDDERVPCLCDRNLVWIRVLETRPQGNRDWAMAVELTPALEDGAKPHVVHQSLKSEAR